MVTVTILKSCNPFYFDMNKWWKIDNESLEKWNKKHEKEMIKKYGDTTIKFIDFINKKDTTKLINGDAN